MTTSAARVPLPPGRAMAGGQNGAHAGGVVEAMKQDPGSAAACILALRPRGPGTGEDVLRAVAKAAAAGWDAGYRAVLQSGEGLALVGFVAPSVALLAARRAAAHPKAGQVVLALHHGPVRVLDGQRVAGESLTRAALLASLAGTRTLVSETFRQALAADAPRLARELDAASDVSTHDGDALYRDDMALARQRAQRRSLLAAGGIVALLGAGAAGRIARESYEAAHRPALVLLDIRPSGEIFVDGVPQGTSPPLTRLPVPPGAHTIEVRGARAKPLVVQVYLQPGQELSLQHVFPLPPRRPAAPPKGKPVPAPAPGPFERFRFW
ncbi:hypothetical protein GCM10028796_04510 [Ramlibacter monticola]|uniref:PEGA domain-containing protein n=1 Tax=Ramlibacter monticola TaxID=1926872 RepID=A0A936YZ95_9BURK|nr:hypothetical protein [Ramlibacter monticola]MBL0391266.1 hypothetical protein [Ramlibacter monticola]